MVQINIRTVVSGLFTGIEGQAHEMMEYVPEWTNNAPVQPSQDAVSHIILLTINNIVCVYIYFVLRLQEDKSAPRFQTFFFS